MAGVFEAVGAVRDVRTRNNIPPKVALDAVFSVRDEAAAALLKAGAEIVRGQANVDKVEVGLNLPKPRFSAAAARSAFALYVPLEGKIDRAAELERSKKELEKAREQAGAAEKQLSNEEFRKRKPEMAAEIAGKLADLKAKAGELEAHLRELEDGAK
jgi:valyl-tRNA synthetase